MTDNLPVELIQVIRTRIGHRGTGRGPLGETFRLLTQYWTTDGELLATIDPIQDVVTNEQLDSHARVGYRDGYDSRQPEIDSLIRDLEDERAAHAAGLKPKAAKKRADRAAGVEA